MPDLTSDLKRIEVEKKSTLSPQAISDGEGSIVFMILSRAL